MSPPSTALFKSKALLLRFSTGIVSLSSIRSSGYDDLGAMSSAGEGGGWSDRSSSPKQLSSRSTSCWQALMEMLTSFPSRIYHLPTVPILPNAWLIMLLLWLTSQPIHATQTPQTVKKKTINTWPKNTDELKAKKATWSPACHAALMEYFAY